ncbi:hypothetical protein BDZ89DRAFT_1059390, partial [Hymenopellis radicata]
MHAVVCAKIQTLSAAAGHQNKNKNWEKIDQTILESRREEQRLPMVEEGCG